MIGDKKIHETKDVACQDIQYKILFALFPILTLLGISFGWLLLHGDIPISELFLALSVAIFPTSKVYGFYGVSHGGYLFIYALISLVLILHLISIFLTVVVLRKKIQHLRFVLNGEQILLTIAIFLFLIANIQWINSMVQFSGEYQTFAKKSVSQRNRHIYGISYIFAKNCQKHLKGLYSGKLITNLDLENGYWKTEHRKLAYHLYPLNIRRSKSNKPDFYLYYMKQDAQELIPEGYQIKYQHNEYFLMAVREDLL